MPLEPDKHLTHLLRLAKLDKGIAQVLAVVQTCAAADDLLELDH